MRASYTDTFTPTLDEKRRLTIPSEWRDEGYEPQLFVFPSEDGCLKVYPNSWMADLQERNAGLEFDHPKQKSFELLARIAQKLSWDAQGRVRIKDSLLEHAGIKRHTLLVGAFGHFEIWDPERQREAASAVVSLEEGLRRLK